ncbi:PREDICTED: uncharacterized protein LOC105559921 [Vollenhovia emeryi]|uniref:uncharacterized protein LOC105559921 n=1 Tax=Vollenhovia emeryi TaxID=411798 RepID=UPI0005F4B5AD|nr:PREDICTED: uncharacterized protein LOC105559921 [Vollenhovia emeryi]
MRQVEVSVTDEKCEKELRKAVVKAGTDATHDVLRKIRPQIDLVVTSLYNELEQTHRAQREKMIVEFNEIVRKQQLKQDARIREIERVKMEELRVQRHEFEIRNVANIICIVCMERLRGSLQLQATHEHFQEKIKSLHELVAKQEETVNVMEARITKYRNENKALKEKIDALSEEFQKFINFAFNTLPEHADFLLPLDLLSINSTNKEDKQEKKRQIN